MRKTNVVTADTILRQYKRLQTTLGGDRHVREHLKLEWMVRNNQDQLYELIFSGKVKDEADLLRLICFGGHPASVAKDKNEHWIPFLKRVRERENELPNYIRLHFNWLGTAHHYWDEVKPKKGILRSLLRSLTF